MTEDSFRYAGWFTVDLRMLATLVVFSAAAAVLILALHFKGRRWDEYVVGFLAVFALALGGSVLLTNVLGVFPALRLETLFPVP